MKFPKDQLATQSFHFSGFDVFWGVCCSFFMNYIVLHHKFLGFLFLKKKNILEKYLARMKFSLSAYKLISSFSSEDIPPLATKHGRICITIRLPDCDCPCGISAAEKVPYFQQTVQSNEQMYLWREALLFVCHTWGAEEGLAETRQNKQIASTGETEANTFSEPLSEKKSLALTKSSPKIVPEGALKPLQYLCQA